MAPHFAITIGEAVGEGHRAPGRNGMVTSAIGSQTELNYEPTHSPVSPIQATGTRGGCPPAPSVVACFTDEKAGT